MRTPNWIAMSVGIGAAMGAATHAMATWLCVCIVAGAVAEVVSSKLRGHAVEDRCCARLPRRK